MVRPRAHLSAAGNAALALLVAAAPAAAIELRPQSLTLAGAPAAALSVDLDRDGRRDLALAVVGTDWGEIGVDETRRVDELGTYVEVLTVVPALLDRRELAVHLGLEGGGFTAEPLRLELPESVHALVAGPPAAPLLAWTAAGVSTVELAGGALALVPRIEAASPLAGSRSFLGELPLAADVDADGVADLLLPVEGGLAIHLGRAEGLAAEPSQRVAIPLDERLPGDPRHYLEGPRRNLPLPLAADLDGDRLPELLFRNHDRGWNEIRALPNLGGGRFGPPFDPLAGRPRDAEPEVVWLGELDGAPGAELVTAEPLDGEGEKSLRAGLAAARRPRFRYRVHGFGPDRRWRAAAGRELTLEGFVFAGGDGPELSAGVRDLDGDGRGDLVALAFDFSMLQAVRVVAARSLRLGIAFTPHCQQPDGGFAARPDPDLAGRFTVRLDRLQLGRIASFAGDFDGDGRADFLQLGHGREAELRLGLPGCRFARAANTLRLAAEPPDLSLVRVADLDGDGRSDVAVTFPPPPGEPGRGARLDLHLSGSGR